MAPILALENAIADPLARWEASPLADYYLRIEQRCFCFDTSTYVTWVDDGVAVSTIVASDGNPHHAAVDDSLWTPTTVEDLYELLRTYREFGDPGATSAYAFTLDDSGRWPTSISIDPIVGGDDDELELTITVETEQPELFETELVEVPMATGLIDAWTPVPEVSTSIEVVRVPAGSVPANMITAAELDNLDGHVAAASIARNQILTDALFIDPTSLDLPDGLVPDGMFAYSLDYDLAHEFMPDDVVTVTTRQATFEAQVLAIGTGPPTVTLLVTDLDKISLALTSRVTIEGTG